MQQDPSPSWDTCGEQSNLLTELRCLWGAEQAPHQALIPMGSRATPSPSQDTPGKWNDPLMELGYHQEQGNLLTKLRCLWGAEQSPHQALVPMGSRATPSPSRDTPDMWNNTPHGAGIPIRSRATPSLSWGTRGEQDNPLTIPEYTWRMEQPPHGAGVPVGSRVTPSGKARAQPHPYQALEWPQEFPCTPGPNRRGCGEPSVAACRVTHMGSKPSCQ